MRSLRLFTTFFFMTALITNMDTLCPGEGERKGLMDGQDRYPGHEPRQPPSGGFGTYYVEFWREGRPE